MGTFKVNTCLVLGLLRGSRVSVLCTLTLRPSIRLNCKKKLLRTLGADKRLKKTKYISTMTDFLFSEIRRTQIDLWKILMFR